MSVDLYRGTQGVNLPPAVSAEIWAQTVQDSTVMAAARRISLPGNGVAIPVITGDAEAGWVGETDPIGVSRPTLENKVMTPYKLAVIVPFSNEFRRDLPALHAELVRRLPAALGKKFDETAFGKVAAPGTNFDTLAAAPLLNVTRANTFTEAAAVLEALAAQDQELTHWHAAPALHGLLLTATDAVGRPFFINDAQGTGKVGSVFGAPVLRTKAALGAGQIGVAGNFAGSAVYGTVEGVKISLSDQASLKDGNSTINLWQSDMFAVKAEIEVGFRVRNSQHFVRVGAGA